MGVWVFLGLLVGALKSGVVAEDPRDGAPKDGSVDGVRGGAFVVAESEVSAAAIARKTATIRGDQRWQLAITGVELEVSRVADAGPNLDVEIIFVDDAKLADVAGQ